MQSSKLIVYTMEEETAGKTVFMPFFLKNNTKTKNDKFRNKSFGKSRKMGKSAQKYRFIVSNMCKNTVSDY